MQSETDKHLDAVLIGGREQRPITIVDYDPAWPGLYDGLAQAIEAALGPAALTVDHIGSTSVPGLAAKAIIDILVTVHDVEDESAFMGRLESAGFVLRVREPGHRMFRTPAKDVHIHIFAAGDPAIPNYLDLRDWLRHDATDRALYANTKRELAQQQWTDMNYYADAKTDVIAAILARARAWRAGEARRR